MEIVGQYNKEELNGIAVTKIKQNLIDENNYNSKLKRYLEARVLYMNNLPIVISTEKTSEELLDFDEVVGSRIIEMSKGDIIQLQGRELNYRLYSQEASMKKESQQIQETTKEFLDIFKTLCYSCYA